MPGLENTEGGKYFSTFMGEANMQIITQITGDYKCNRYNKIKV